MPSFRTQLARHLRNNTTVSERRLWSHLRGRKVDGWKFRRQAPIGEYIVDFVCLAAKLVIELDGFTHDDSKFKYDRRRQAWLESQGYKVLTFSSDFRNSQSFESVIETIYFELASSIPSRASGRRFDLMRASPPSGEVTGLAVTRGT